MEARQFITSVFLISGLIAAFGATSFAAASSACDTADLKASLAGLERDKVPLSRENLSPGLLEKLNIHSTTQEVSSEKARLQKLNADLLGLYKHYQDEGDDLADSKEYKDELKNYDSHIDRDWDWAYATLAKGSKVIKAQISDFEIQLKLHPEEADLALKYAMLMQAILPNGGSPTKGNGIEPPHCTDWNTQFADGKNFDEKCQNAVRQRQEVERWFTWLFAQETPKGYIKLMHLDSLQSEVIDALDATHMLEKCVAHLKISKTAETQPTESERSMKSSYMAAAK